MFVGWVGAVDTCSVKLVATVMCLLVFLVSDIIGVTSLLWGDARIIDDESVVLLKTMS